MRYEILRIPTVQQVFAHSAMSFGLKKQHPLNRAPLFWKNCVSSFYAKHLKVGINSKSHLGPDPNFMLFLSKLNQGPLS